MRTAYSVCDHSMISSLTILFISTSPTLAFSSSHIMALNGLVGNFNREVSYVISQRSYNQSD